MNHSECQKLSWLLTKQTSQELNTNQICPIFQLQLQTQHFHASK